jgi:hypothetical protein
MSANSLISLVRVRAFEPPDGMWRLLCFTGCGMVGEQAVAGRRSFAAGLILWWPPWISLRATSSISSSPMVPGRCSGLPESPTPIAVPPLVDHGGRKEQGVEAGDDDF